MTGGSGEITVRTARAADRDAIRALTMDAYAEFERVMEPSAWAGLAGAVGAALELWEGVEWIVAEREGRIVGSVLLFPAGADAYRGAAKRAGWPELRLLSVAGAERGRGVGRRLVEACIDRARRSGAGALGLHTSRSMERAIGLYERMGFERVPEHDFQPPGAELVTAYRLALDER